MGPTAASLLLNKDGTIWTENYRLQIGPDGLSVLENQSSEEGVQWLVAAIGDNLIDNLNVIRRPQDLRRVGLLNEYFLNSGKNVVFREDSGLVYLGGGRYGYSIAAFDPNRMTMTAFWGVSLSSETTDHAGRLVAIGAEGFATAFGSHMDDNFGRDGAGGDILFVPTASLQPVAPFPLPAPQPPSGAIRYFPVPVQGATVDQASGQVYFSLASDVPGIGNSILPFSPADGSFGAPVWAGSEPYVGVVTADSQFLYLSLAGSRLVDRFRLPSLAVDTGFGIFDWTFGWFSDATPVPLNVNVLQVPGAPSTTIAVLRGGGWGVAIFDNGVQRPETTSQIIPGCTLIEGVDSAQFAPSGGLLFGIDNYSTGFGLARFAVTPDGLVPQIGQEGLSGGFNALLRCSDSLCITSTGLLIDPIQMTRVRMFGNGPFGGSGSGDATYGPFSSGTRVAPDFDNDRAYFYLPVGRPPDMPAGIYAFAISTGQETGWLSGSFPQGDMQLLPSGELMLSDETGIALVPIALLR